jgi:hypothetical protein
VTGIESVDKAQEGVGDLVGGQLGKGGVAENVGDIADKNLLRGPG